MLHYSSIGQRLLDIAHFFGWYEGSGIKLPLPVAEISATPQLVTHTCCDQSCG
jgi:hypothetical protein